MLGTLFVIKKIFLHHVYTLLTVFVVSYSSTQHTAYAELGNTVQVVKIFLKIIEILIYLFLWLPNLRVLNIRRGP